MDIDMYYVFKSKNRKRWNVKMFKNRCLIIRMFVISTYKEAINNFLKESLKANFTLLMLRENNTGFKLFRLTRLKIVYAKSGVPMSINLSSYVYFVKAFANIAVKSINFV
jgi:hypothetical protein